MSEAQKPNGERVIVGNLDAMLTTGDPRTQIQQSFKVTGYLYSDDTPREVHERVDTFQAVIDRQVNKIEIVRKRDQRRAHLLNIEQIKKTYDEALDKRNAGKRLKTVDLQRIEQGDATLRAATEALAKIDADISDLEARVRVT
jgi:translation elongation factor EF-Tu-like GTPase